MKFIRDIIDEKRQMNHQVNGVSASNGATGLMVEELQMPCDPALEAPKPQAEPVIDTITSKTKPYVAETYAAEKLQIEDTKDLTKSLSEFFEQENHSRLKAESESKEVHNILPAETDEPQPTTLVLQKRADTEVSESLTDPVGSPEVVIDETDKIDIASTAPLQPMAKVLRTAITVRPPEETAERNIFMLDEAASSSEPPLAGPEPATAEPAPAQVPPRVQAQLVEMPLEAPGEPPAPQAQQSVDVSQPAMGRGYSRQGRVKTRLLGFNTGNDAEIDPISGRKEATAAPFTTFPVGWLIVTDGPGRGSAFTLFNGVSNIGRGKDQTVPLDFGDNSISRESHAAIAYDPAHQSFYIGHGGKANLVRRNDRPVLSTEELSAGDQITIGETTLRFVPLCGSDFTWDGSERDGRTHASDE